MDLLPIFMNVQNRRALVVGGGEVAVRKIELLLDAGAAVHVVSPDLAPALQDYHAQNRLGWRQGRFEPADLDAAYLVIAATNDEAVNQQVSLLAQERQLPVNVVDSPALCSFVMPSIIDRSPVQIAVSTGGTSPVLARLLRAHFESTIPAAYGRLARLAESFRDQVKAKFSDINSRRNFWEHVLQGKIAEMVFTGNEEQARAALQAELDASRDELAGEVYLVGGGPGDPDLLTFRALRLMQQADVIVHDRLVSKQVLNLCRRDADRIYVGKERDNHAMPQEEINKLLVRLAKEGKRVCRLKGGDPFIFGRGGEEIETLAAEGINFQVVPGITAAIGMSSYAGIPLTHRDHSQAVTFVTGHLKDGSMNLNWPALAQPNQTVVFYMGLKGLPVICENLIKHGRSKDTPMALVQQATTPRQKEFVGTLGSMIKLIEKEEIKAPTLIVVGEVVKLHKKFSWFEPQEYYGDENPSV